MQRNKFILLVKGKFCQVLFLYVLLCSFQAKAQTTSGFKNEAGINFVNLLYYQPASMESQQVRAINLFNGIFYKRHIGKHILRSSFEYDQTKINISDILISASFNYSSCLNYYLTDIRMGYERLFPIKQFAFYIGLDGVYKYQQLNGSYESYGYFEPYFRTEYFRYGYHYVGVAPLAGFRYQFLRHFSASIETSMEQLYLVSSNNNNNVHRKMLFNPVRSVGISYLFGRK